MKPLIWLAIFVLIFSYFVDNNPPLAIVMGVGMILFALADTWR